MSRPKDLADDLDRQFAEEERTFKDLFGFLDAAEERIAFEWILQAKNNVPSKVSPRVITVAALT